MIRKILESIERDPAEPSNKVHRTKGGQNLAFIEEVYGNGDDYHNLIDFLSELLHASGGTLNIDKAVRIAKDHYQEEGVDDPLDEDSYYDEPTNKERRDLGGLLINYLKKVYDEYEEDDVINLTDFLADILHASGGTIDIAKAAEMAKMHYEAEGID